MHTSQFKALKSLHTSLLVFFGFFIIIDVVLISQKLMENLQDKTMDFILQVVAAVLSVGGLLGGFSIYKKRLIAARTDTGSGEARFLLFRGACILWWAILEGPGMFASVAYLLTGNTALLILALFHWGLLFVFMPKKENIILLLNLTSEDVQKLEGVTP